MRESRSYGSVRGALGNERPYREQFLIDVGLSCDGLMGSSPERPCDDVGGLDASFCEADGDTADFLNRPTDQYLGGLVV